MQELNSIGVASFILDSFAGRAIVNTSTDQSQLDSLAMMVDALRALALLAEHSRIDPNRIAVMGLSKGAVAAVYSSNQRFLKLHALEAHSSRRISGYTRPATFLIGTTKKRRASPFGCSMASLMTRSQSFRVELMSNG